MSHVADMLFAAADACVALADAEGAEDSAGVFAECADLCLALAMRLDRADAFTSCADACTRCAEACEALGSDQALRCAQACRLAADACRPPPFNLAA